MLPETFDWLFLPFAPFLVWLMYRKGMLGLSRRYPNERDWKRLAKSPRSLQFSAKYARLWRIAAFIATTLALWAAAFGWLFAAPMLVVLGTIFFVVSIAWVVKLDIGMRRK